MLLIFLPKNEDLKSIASSLNEQLNNEETSFKTLVADAQFSPTSNEELLSLKNEKEVSFDLYIYTNDSLLFYTSNKVLLDLPPSLYSQNMALIQLQNGWYLFQKSISKNITIVGLSLVKNQYKIENEFLSNNEQIKGNVLDGIELTDKQGAGIIGLSSISGQAIGGLYNDTRAGIQKVNLGRVASSWILLFIALYLLWWLAAEVAARGQTAVSVLFLGMLLLSFRTVLIILELPIGDGVSRFFDPTIFASSFFAKSLGQLVISLSFYALWLIFVVKKLTDFSSRIELLVGEIVYFGLLGFSSFVIVWLFKALVLDSQISLELYDVLSLSFYSLIALATVMLVFLVHFFILKNSVLLLHQTNKRWMVVMSVFVVYSIACFLNFDEQELEITLVGGLWLAVYIFITVYVAQKGKTLFNWKYIVVHLLMASLLSMFLLENLYENKERQQRLFFGNKLLAGHNFLAEYGFKQLNNSLKNDAFIQSYLYSESIPYKELKDRLSVLYFRDHFQNFDFDVFLFDKQKNSLKSTDTLTEANIRSRLYTIKSHKDTLVFIEDSIFTSDYLGFVDLQKDSQAVATMAILFKPKLFNAQTVYPELLSNKQFSGIASNSNYNYAVYLNDKINFQSGNFPYSYYLDKHFAGTKNAVIFFETNDWEHLVLQSSGLKKVIVSIPQEGFFEPMATFSYFFILYMLFVVLAWAYAHFFIQKPATETDDFIKISFRTKLQIALLSLVALSFIVIGIVTISFIKQQYDGYYTDRFSRKVKSILTGLEYALQDPNIAYRLSNDLVRLEATKLSEVNGIDINLYDAEGWLVQSTRPEIFQQGLVSKKISPIAFDNLALKQSNQIVLAENIGKLDYFSFYIPLRNKQRVTLGYLNIPYFEKSNDVNKEVSSFLVTLMNVYAFLLLCAGIFSFFISNSITRPLRFIGEKIRRINLEKTNEPIKWKSNDEIGKLINEYNKMIKELEGSAKDLARSERESAWRQMARQIAHEIKNPLTPMKLSIQYLQRAIDENNPNVGELAKKVNRTLIEQIDNLSSIATAFSSFAQMPKPNNEYINLNQILSDIVSLFEKETTHQITFQSYYEDAVVLADRNQLISVFNNLIKNAIQSLEESDSGQIDVLVLEEYGEVKVVVMDNGKGIPATQFDKVFVPNFTTKSSGTGLGLAISKQIIDMSRGKIWFESEIEIGTKFYVSLPHQNIEKEITG